MDSGGLWGGWTACGFAQCGARELRGRRDFSEDDYLFPMWRMDGS